MCAVGTTSTLTAVSFFIVYAEQYASETTQSELMSSLSFLGKV